MSSKRKIMSVLLIGLLLFVGLACSLFDNLQKANQTKETAEAFITNADIGISTVQALVTDVGVQLTESGILETAQAFATEIPIPTFEGEVPDDIPVMDGNKTGLVESSSLVSYIINEDYQAVVDYYEREMAALGWSKVDSETQKQDSYSQLVFEKNNRKATVIITQVPFLNQTSVTIEIREN